MKIIFATNNPHKINEIRSVLPGRYTLIPLDEVGITDDIPELEDTLEGNALSKARFVFEKTRQDVFADDTGLEVITLGMRPGVHSARYAGDQKNSDDNINLLLRELVNAEDRRARFRTVIALILSGQEYLFEGIVNGEIAKSRSGNYGFGYDPVFIPEGGEKSFAELPLIEKNRTSHRARAIKKLAEFLGTRLKQ